MTRPDLPPALAGFDLVIFDCDGVLIDSEVISARMLIAELAEVGITVDRAHVARHFLGRSFPTVAKHIEGDFGITLPAGFETAYRNRLERAFAEDLHVVPGVEALIDGLPLPYMLATSSSPSRLAMSLRITGLDRLFEGRCTTASEVKNGKPAPDLFLHAAARAGVAPTRCLVIEDSVPGLRAGLAAGMEVWHFAGASHLAGMDLPDDPEVRPHRRFDRFADFYDWPAKIRSEHA